MANNGRIKLGVDIELNKSSLASLKSALNEVQLSAKKAQFQGTLTTDLKNAAIEAERLTKILNESWNSKLGQLDLSKLNKGIEQSYGNVNNLKKAMEKGGIAGVNAYNKIASSVLTTNIQLKQSNQLLDKMATTMANTVRYGISSSVFNRLTNSISDAYGYVKSLDRSLNDIRIVTDYSADSMERFAKQANAAAKSLGASTRDYTEASLIYYQQGLSEADTQAKTKTTLKAANVTGQSTAEVSEQLTAVWNGYKVEAAEAELYVDKLAAVATTTAADLEELSTGMSKVASAANLMGVDIDQLNAQLATIVSVTRQAPESVGTALKTIYARMGDIEAGLDGEVSLDEYTEKMAAMGINVLDAKGQLRDMGEVIEEIGNNWGNFSREQQVALSQIMAGTRQYNNLLSLFDNWGMYTKALQTSADAAGELQRQQDIYMDSIDAHLQQLSTEAEKTYDILFDEDVIKSFADAATKALSVVNDYLTGLGGGMNSLATLGLNAANIFSKQIGGALGTAAYNKQAEQKNARDVLITQQWGAAGSANVKEGLKLPTSQALDEQVKYYEKIQSISGQLNQEDATRLNNSLTKIGQLKEEIAFAENWKEIAAQEIGKEAEEVTKTDVYSALENTKKQSKQLKDEIEDFKQAIERYNEVMKNQDEKWDSDEEKEQVLGRIKTGLSYRKTLDESNFDLNDKEQKKQWKEYQKEQKQIEKIQKKMNQKKGNKSLTDDEIKLSLKGYQQDIAETEEKVYNLRGAWKGAQEEQQETIRDKQREFEIEKANIETAYEKNKLAEDYSTIVSGVSVILSTASSIQGIFTTITDEDLSGWEKFSSISSVVIMQGGMILSNWTQLAKLLPTLTTMLGMYNTTEAAGVAIKEKGILVTIKSIAIKLKELAVTKLQVLWEAILAVLKGDITALGVAGIIAITAATVALGAYVVKLIQASSEEAKLKKEIEETSEAVQKAKDSYNELSKKISNYKDAQAGIEKLSEGTLEWYDAIRKANEAAQELIELWDLVAGRDYTIGKGGLITIDKDILSNKQYQAQQSIFTAEAANTMAKYNYADYQQQKIVEKFQKEVNNKARKEGSEAYLTYDQAEQILSKDKITYLGDIINTEVAKQEHANRMLSGSEYANKQGYKIGKEIVEAVNTTSDAQIQAQKESSIDISESIGKYITEYEQKEAEKESLTMQAGKQMIYGSLSQQDLNRYSSLPTLIQNLIAQEVGTDAAGKTHSIRTYNQVNRGDRWQDAWQASWRWDDSDTKLNQLKENTKMVREEYAKNILGWKETSTGWVDADNNTVKLTDIDEDTARNAYNSGQLGTTNITDKQINKYQKVEDKFRDASSDTSRSLMAQALFALQNGKTGVAEFKKTYGSFDVLTDEEKESVKSQLGRVVERKKSDKEIAENKAKYDRLRQEEVQRYSEQQLAKRTGPNGQVRKLTPEEMLEEAADMEAHMTKWEQEYAYLLDMGEEYYSNFKDYTKAEIDAFLENSEQVGISVARLKLEKEEYNKILSVEAQALGTTTTALKLYAGALANAGKITKDLNKENAKSAAARYKFNKAYNNTIDIYTDNEDAFNAYMDALKNGEEVSYDVADAAGAVVESLSEMFGVDMADADFLKENAEDIGKVLNGTAKEAEEAAKRLEKAGMKQLLEETFDLDFDVQSVKDEFGSLLSELQNLEAGDTLSENFTRQLMTMVNNAHMTTAEVEALFAGLNLEMPAIDSSNVENSTPTVDTLSTPESVKYHTYQGQMPDPDNPEKNVDVNYSWTETIHTAEVPYVKWTDDEIANTTIKSTGSKVSGGNFTKKQNTGGNKSKPKKVDKTENEKDRYHDVNIELKQISNELDKLNNQKDKLFGGDLIANTANQLKLLNQQIETTNKKIKIAEGEASELRKKLAGQGVKFNKDGTMSNYAAAYDKQLAALNKIEDKYNSLSAKGQEKYQETYDKAKEKFQKFIEDMSRYNELVTDFIPGLETDNQDSINKQIELQIESFNYEIELRLDLKDAELEWNEFKKKIIDGIEDDDILGNAKARLVDVSSYYREDGTGVIQENAEHIQELLAELEEMDKKGSDVYGKGSTQDRVTALEDLQKYYQELMKNLEEVQEIQEEMKQSQLDMMDKAEEKFGEQIEMYEHLSGLIDHDMNLITLTYGETAYDKLAEYYKQQSENNKSQLDFQRQRVEIWRQQMEAEEEGSEAWEKAKENWLAAINDANASLEEAIGNLQDKYLNAINDIFDRLNDKVTDSAGLDYIAEEWDLINQNADQYLDTVNSLFEMQSLENKYLDAIDDTDNVKAQQKLQKMMEEELKMLEEKDKLTQYDIDRANQKYEIALKQIALEEAQQNKNSMRLRRDTQGNYTYQFVADDEQVSQLQDELGDLYNSLYNLDVEQYKSNLDQLQSVYVEFQEKMAEAALINDPEKRAKKELLIKQEYEELINGIVNENEVVRNNLYESTFNDLAYLYDKNVEDFTNMTQAEQDALMNGLIPYWNSGIQSMADVFAGEGGFLPTCKDAFDELNQATQAYEDELQEYYVIAGKSIDEISSGYDKTSEQIQQLIKDNGELIETYDTELEAIKNVVLELDNLITKYKEAELAAKTAAEEAYKYWAAAYGKAADEVEGSKLGQQPQQQNEEPQKDVNEPKKEEPQKPSLTKGSYVNVKSGVKWYSNSYGGGKSGTARSGKITLINANGSHPYNIEGLGWIKKSDIVGYDTGGYTGNWNSREGRLAMLHEKELILNKQDTQNMLNAMQVLRNITANLGTTIMEKMASITAGNMNAIANNFNNGLEQQVHIDAQFPNVTNSTEIEDALNNLVNRASQYITK